MTTPCAPAGVVMLSLLASAGDESGPLAAGGHGAGDATWLADLRMRMPTTGIGIVTMNDCTVPVPCV